MTSLNGGEGSAGDSDTDLRPGADSCYKCSTCDTACPVAAVDEEFPGPKFQGPEQWRLKRRHDHDIDPSIMDCSNCMRCDHACPADVPLTEMHNTARAEYVEEHLSRFSAKYVRNRLLANYGRLARLASRVPRVANLFLNNPVSKRARSVLGITPHREMPTFARQTFREWWRSRGGSKVSAPDRRVAYFHGDYANFNTPEVGQAMVRVYEYFGYEVVVPEQRCSGTPMFANGMMKDARAAARYNVDSLAEYVTEGIPVICTCTSCSMALRREYPELFDFEHTDLVATNTWDAVEFLREREPLAQELQDADATHPDLAYHAPCHARNQGLGSQTPELLAHLDAVETIDVGESCSGISGTYGWKSEQYETSMAIGEPMFDHMADAGAKTGLTECPTCAMQMEHGSGYETKHTLEVLEATLVDT